MAGITAEIVSYQTPNWISTNYLRLENATTSNIIKYRIRLQRCIPYGASDISDLIILRDNRGARVRSDA
jgi:hypothetical protein